MNIPQHMTKDQIDERLNFWYQAIEESVKNIPLKTRQFTHKSITSPRIRLIQHHCNELKRNSALQGWTRQDYCRYQMPRTMLENESERIWKENRERKMANTEKKKLR